MTTELRVVDDIAEAAVELFLEVAPRTVGLSGGGTPRPAYERLARTSYPWSDVDVFFVDDRCVPPEHPDSNYRLANETLLEHVDARVHDMVGCDADVYEHEVRNALGEPDGVPRLDFLFMGVGPDGHTASLFPGKPALEVEDRLIVYVPEPGWEPFHPRLTMTFPLLNAARLSAFLVKGEDKRERVRQMLAGEDIPAARVRSERVVILADRAAAPD
jgi:6-phosphogluconolactonase